MEYLVKSPCKWASIIVAAIFCVGLMLWYTKYFYVYVYAVLITAVVVCPCIWLRLNQCDCEDIEKNERNTNEQDKDSDPEYGKEAVVDEYGKEAVCNDGARTDNIPLDSSGCDISETGLNPVREESAVYNDEARTDDIPLDIRRYNVCKAIAEESALSNVEYCTYNIPLFKRWSDLKDLMDSYERNLN
ncbi:hypothetical protein Tco_1198490 [Tanacetum coccineum]